MNISTTGDEYMIPSIFEYDGLSQIRVSQEYMKFQKYGSINKYNEIMAAAKKQRELNNKPSAAYLALQAQLEDPVTIIEDCGAPC